MFPCLCVVSRKSGIQQDLQVWCCFIPKFLMYRCPLDVLMSWKAAPLNA